MREIKFRVWDSSDKRMRNWDEFKHMSIRQFFIGLHLDRNWPVMQFAGFYDRNGNDVYSGDILKDSSEMIYVLDDFPFGTHMFLKKEYTYFINQKEYFLKEGGALGEVLSRQNVRWLKKCEILGNIHENPELVK